MRYVRPAVSYLKSNQSWIAWAQTGDFFITFTNEQNGCCEHDDCGPPDNTPIPIQIAVNDGTIILVLRENCALEGNIDQNGSFVIVFDPNVNENCNFRNDSCSNLGPEPNQCCTRDGVITITGTYRDSHLQGSYVNQETPSGDPDCTGPSAQECTETGDFTGDFV